MGGVGSSINFGRALRIARGTRDVSQRQLAALAQLDSSYVSMVEAGKRMPSIKTLQSLAAALQMPLYILVLLASDRDDLAGVTPEQAGRQVEELLQIIQDGKVGAATPD